MRARSFPRLPVVVALGAVVGLACAPPPVDDAGPSPSFVRVDPFGYLPGLAVDAVVVGRARAPPLSFTSESGETSTLRAGAATTTDSLAGTPLVEQPLALPGAGRVDDVEVVVGPHVYGRVLPAVLDFLRAQRCGPILPAQDVPHDSCHLAASVDDPSAFSGDGVVVEGDAALPITEDSGPHTDVEGGWHGAGDYTKYVGSTSFVLVLDLLALRDHPDGLESDGAGRVAAPLKDELHRALVWLEKMVARDEPLHQVSQDHPSLRPPEADSTTHVDGYEERPAYLFDDGAGGDLLGRAAAAFALGAAVFPDERARFLDDARIAYAHALARPAPQQPVPASTAIELSVDDDVALAAALLARASGDPVDADLAVQRALALDPPIATLGESLHALAIREAALLFDDGAPERADLAAQLDSVAADVVAQAATNPWGYAVDGFGAGSLAAALGAATTCLAAHDVTPNPACVEVAAAQVHWLLGRNPWGRTFVVGLGVDPPTAPHHALAASRGVVLTGAIVGGPTSRAVLDDAELAPPGADDPDAPFSTAARLYHDDADDHVVNEPAIDFTAALVFTMAALLDF